jgi:prolipoprotein diacylglyceryl transferase
MIAVGAFLAVQLFGARLERLGIGTRDDAARIATFALPAGVLGSRLYHAVTAWDLYRDRPLDALRFWEGGLGIWGGIAAGVVVGVLVARRRGLPGASVVTAVTPALPLAQAFGRWGNWFNQELFGRPTGLPWGLEVSGKSFPSGFEPETLFHPTFLYESLGCLLLVVVLLVVERSVRLRPGRLFLVYVAGYSLLRFPVEALRIDPAPVLAGLRLSQWVAVVLFVVSSGILLRDRLTDRFAP